jgi:hypothetical protein
MMHVSRAFELALDREGCNIFEAFGPEEFKQVGGLGVGWGGAG